MGQDARRHELPVLAAGPGVVSGRSHGPAGIAADTAPAAEPGQASSLGLSPA